MKGLENYQKVLDLVREHNAYSQETINLIASYNTPSRAIYEVLGSDFNNRVAEGTSTDRCFPMTRYYDEIESIGKETCKNLFGFDYSDLRPISGTHANMAIYSALTKPGDTVMTLDIDQGGHISMAGKLPQDVFQLNVESVIFDSENKEIDIDETVKKIRKNSPKIIMLGGSVMLFPHPIEKIAEAAREVGAILVYDASHVAGLIAGGEFQKIDPKHVDILVFSTCKTIPGPQSGVICSSNKFKKKIQNAIFPTLTSSHHLHESIGAILALIELENFGDEYAKHTIENAKAIGKGLSDIGFNVLFSDNGFTESHTILMDCSVLGGGKTVESRLEEANIITNRNLLPGDKSFLRPSGLRIGSQEMTHLGLIKILE